MTDNTIDTAADNTETAQTAPEPELTLAGGSTPAATTQPDQSQSQQVAINPDGTFREGWTHNESLAKKFSSLESLTKSYENLERMLGGEKMPVPRDDSPDDVWGQVYEKLGRPVTPDEYKLDKPDDLPETIQWRDEHVADFKQLAHKLGLNQKQAQALVQYDLERNMAAVESFEATRNETQQQAEANLRKQWGASFAENLNLARAAASALDDSIMSDPAIANNPKIIDMLAKVGAMMGENRLKAPRSMVTMHTDVDAEITQIQQKNPSNPYSAAYWNATHPDHQKAVDYMARLYERKYPAQSASPV